MEWNIISIIFWVIFIDAITAVLLAFFTNSASVARKIPSLARFLPNARRWSIVYIALVIIAGGVLTNLGLLVTFW